MKLLLTLAVSLFYINLIAAAESPKKESRTVAQVKDVHLKGWGDGGKVSEAESLYRLVPDDMAHWAGGFTNKVVKLNCTLKNQNQTPGKDDSEAPHYDCVISDDWNQ